MLPAITFIFSRKACDEARDACLDAGLRLTTPDERARVRAIVDERLVNLADADLHVLGYDRFLAGLDRKSVVEGKRVSVRVDLGGRRIIKKKKTQKKRGEKHK